IALESFTLSASRLEGDIVLRVPGTVFFHYVINLESDGTVSRSVLDLKPLGVPNMATRRTTLDFVGDSVRVDLDSAGVPRRLTVAAKKGAVPLLTTGFGASLGIYTSFGMYELLLSHLPIHASDTAKVVTVGALSGAVSTKPFLRPSATQVEVDFFRIAWMHVKLDENGHVVSADAIETTEKTRTMRTDFIDVPAAANQYAGRDRAGHGLGLASPDTLVRTKLGPANIILEFGRPSKRNREILGNVVPYDKVWRTGANAASALSSDRELTIGGKTIPAGSHTLWTLPKRDGVDLIVNRQVGQWGTDYDPSRDLVRIPMTVSTAAAPQEQFAITITGSGSSGELHIQWDTFVWSVPVTVK
ncbi:MAG TPA: DUF2911 domain-containing protein, partial [Gemmatimonadaceae bacterium]